MERLPRSPGRPRSSTVSVVCRPAGIFSGGFFRSASQATLSNQVENIKISDSDSLGTQDNSPQQPQSQQQFRLPDLPSTTSTTTEHPAQDTDSMDTSNNTKLSTAYYQTRTARRANSTRIMHDLDSNTTATSQQPHIGSFDTDPGIEHCFIASRSHDSNNIHQNMALSFDPTDLTCTTCTNKHSIRQSTGDMPLTFVVSDQGFPGVMVGGEGGCLKTVRIEDGGLHEVTDLFMDMFSGGLASGTIILLGSVTSMLHKGSSGYVFDWLACAKKLNSKWGNVKVCPMLPFWNDTIPGEMHRVILETGTAFSSLFGGDPRGMRTSWDTLKSQLKSLTPHTTHSELNKHTYTLPYPATLNGPLTVKNITFTTSHPSPATLHPVDRKAKQTLVRTLADDLNKSLAAGIDSAAISERVANPGRSSVAKDSHPPPTPHYVVFGSSHMKRVIPFLTAKGLTVTDLTQQSWHLNKRNTESLKNMLEGVRMHAGSFLIADLFGNTSVKYRQEDDTLALAVKSGGRGGEGGGWHMMGDVVPSPDETLVGQIRGLRPVLELMKDVKKVFIPPIPRFVFGGCCDTKHHAPNTASPEHPAKMLSEHIRQRHTITKAFIDSKTAHFRVTDVLSIFSSTHDSITDKARKFRTFSHKDNVHLTPAGYRLLAEEIVLDCNTISAKQQINAKQAASKPPPPSEEKVWQGFRTTRGVGRTSAVPQRGRGGYRHHPYRRN